MMSFAWFNSVSRSLYFSVNSSNFIISSFQIWIFNISISNLKDKEKINKIIVLTIDSLIHLYVMLITNLLLCSRRIKKLSSFKQNWL
jgi:hypothetical protein